MGFRQLAALVRSLREEFDFPIFLNADHAHSLPDALLAAEAGFDPVVFDASALPFERDVRKTKEVVVALKGVNPAIIVEGELGDIGTGSEIHETAPDLAAGLTNQGQVFLRPTLTAGSHPSESVCNASVRSLRSHAVCVRLEAAPPGIVRA